VSCGQESPGCASPAEAGEEAANKLGWTYHIVDEKLGVDNGNQRAVHEAIALSPDVLVMYGTNCPEVEQPLKEAKAAGIIVMGVGSLDCNAKGLSGEDVYEQEMQWTKQNPDNERFFEQWGENEAAYAVDASEGKGKIIELSYVGVFGKLLNEGKERILDKCAECEVVDNIEFTAEEQAPNGPIYQKFKTALVQHPEATVVLSSFNTPYTVSGVSKAILDAGRSDLIVVGAEGDGPSNEVIEQEKGITAVAAAYSTSQAAWATMDEINRFMNKEPLVPEGIGFIALAKGHNLPPNGEYYEGAVPYQQEYEKLWNAK
jgi:ribose transport system substrate-binding protein